MNVIVVNGKKYTTNGGSISVINNKVYVDGELLSDCDEFKEKVINITVEGNVEGDISTDVGNITVKGNCTGDVKTTSGDVDCKDVGGDVKTVSGDVKCKFVSCGVHTVSGDISKFLL